MLLLSQLDLCSTELLLGGGVPTTNAATGAVPGAGAQLEAAPSTVEDQPSYPIPASSPLSVSTVVSEQNGFLSSPRSRRKKPRCLWCPITQASTSPPLFYPRRRDEEDATAAIHPAIVAKIKQSDTPSLF
jgi:hypothetical protein